MSLKDRHAGKVVYASLAAAEQAGHGRAAWSDDSDARETAPRVPIIGLDAGCIPGTKPGCSARELERAGRDIVRSRMLAARKRLQHGARDTT